MSPTYSPTSLMPTITPTKNPTNNPTIFPTNFPIFSPSIFPTSVPTPSHIYSSNMLVSSIIGSGDLTLSMELECQPRLNNQIKSVSMKVED